MKNPPASPKLQRGELGTRGENEASKYLQKQGYQILEHNFRTRNGEIDIVAIDKSEKEPVLCFIEVKTRTSDAFGTPFEAITSWKVHFLIRAAQFYKVSHKNLPDALRIDAVSVYLEENEVQKIELLKNITE